MILLSYDFSSAEFCRTRYVHTAGLVACVNNDYRSLAFISFIYGKGSKGGGMDGKVWVHDGFQFPCFMQSDHL